MSRPFQIGLFALILSHAAFATYTTKMGNDPLDSEPGPKGSLELANLKARIGYVDSDPGYLEFSYRGDTAALQSAIDLLAEVRAPELAVVLHGGANTTSRLGVGGDWAFTLWDPEHWYRYNREPGIAASPNFGKPLPPPTIDIYLPKLSRIDWSAIKMPANIQVRDERADANGFSGSLVRGDVFDMRTLQPIANAQIVLEKYDEGSRQWQNAGESKSGPDGRFEFSNLGVGGYHLNVSAAGHASRMAESMQILENTFKKSVVYLVSDHSLKGKVEDTSGAPLAGAELSLYRPLAINGMAYSLPPETKTRLASDAQGEFAFSGLPQGSAIILAHLNGYQPLDQVVRLDVPKVDVVIRMTRAGTIIGRILDRDENPTEDSAVFVSPPGDQRGTWSGHALPKPDGTFEINNVPPGDYLVSTDFGPIRADDPNVVTIHVDVGKTTEITLHQTVKVTRARGG